MNLNIFSDLVSKEKNRGGNTKKNRQMLSTEHWYFEEQARQKCKGKTMTKEVVRSAVTPQYTTQTLLFGTEA